MPRAVQRDGLWWLRPWLDQPREVIEVYVRQHRLRHVDDASNADPRFARSRLRVSVWQPLLAAFNDAEVTLAAVARRAHEANLLLGEVATADLAALADGDRLNVTKWRTLSPARRANALRAWLHQALGRGAPETLVERLLADLPQASLGRWPVDAERQLALHRARLGLMAPPLQRTAPSEETIDLSRPGVYGLPQWGGALEVLHVARGGVAATALAACRLRARGGGEQFQAKPRSTPRSLKKQYQAAGLAAWQRDGPLVYADDRLLFVPGLGLDARWLQGQVERGLALRWRR
jgi:tRNA(Ile)-lysidine synthase